MNKILSLIKGIFIFLSLFSFLIVSANHTSYPNQTPVWIQLESNLSIGSSGWSVKILQSLLSNARLVLADLPITGIYDVATSEAMKKFQKVEGVPETGAMDTVTREKINTFLKKEYLLADGNNLNCMYTESNRITKYIFVGGGHNPPCSDLSSVSTDITIVPAQLVGNVFPGDEISPKIKFFEAKNITSTGVTFVWTTDDVTRYQFEYSTNKTDVNPMQDNDVQLTSDIRIDHTKTLTNLKPSTLYYYEIVSFDNAGNNVTTGVKSFQTKEKEVVIPVPIIPVVAPIPDLLVTDLPEENIPVILPVVVSKEEINKITPNLDRVDTSFDPASNSDMFSDIMAVDNKEDSPQKNSFWGEVKNFFKWVFSKKNKDK